MAIILLQFDSGPIRGFATTLIIGIISSMFTALFMTRVFFSRWVQNPKHRTLSMGQLLSNPKFDFLKWTRVAVISSVAIIVIGIACIVTQRHTLLGMDFTGGYTLRIELMEKPGVWITGRKQRMPLNRAERSLRTSRCVNSIGLTG